LLVDCTFVRAARPVLDSIGCSKKCDSDSIGMLRKNPASEVGYLKVATFWSDDCPGLKEILACEICPTECSVSTSAEGFRAFLVRKVKATNYVIVKVPRSPLLSVRKTL